jgi:Uma2 family endonuclease
MAAQPNPPPLVPVDEYLNTRYRPDVEYVDGELVEREMPTPLHGAFQALLAEYFRARRKQFRVAVYTETRTQIVERSKYRLPDVMLAPAPIVRSKAITGVPWVVIEIQSPEDRSTEQWKRFRDYLSAGVPYLIVLDPEESLAFRVQPGALIETVFPELNLPTGPLPFDTVALFQQLRNELNES